MTTENLLVLGVGNILMGDEGVGVHALRQLEQEELPPNVTLVDGGTGGFHLLSYFEAYNPIVMIDATMDGRPPGTVALIRPRFASDFPRALSAHDIGLRDLIEAAALLAPLPAIFLITVSISSMQPLEMELSPQIRDSIPKIAELVHKIVDAETDKIPPACYVIDGG